MEEYIVGEESLCLYCTFNRKNHCGDILYTLSIGTWYVIKCPLAMYPIWQLSNGNLVGSWLGLGCSEQQTFGLKSWFKSEKRK